MGLRYLPTMVSMSSPGILIVKVDDLDFDSLFEDCFFAGCGGVAGDSDVVFCAGLDFLVADLITWGFIGTGSAGAGV